MASLKDESGTVTIEGLDVSIINKLAENLNSRLQGGLHGEFHEGGSRSGEAIRQAQLPLVFKLTEAIDSFKAEIQKKSAVADADEDKHPKAAATISGNSIKTMEAVAERMMADKLRDHNIKIERLEAQLKKAQEKNDALEADVKALKTKSKKGDHQEKAPKGVDAKVKALEKRVTEIEDTDAFDYRFVPTRTEFDKVDATVNGMRTTINDMRNSIMGMQTAIPRNFTFDLVKDRVAALEARQHKADLVTGVLKSDLEKVKSAVKKSAGMSANYEENTTEAIKTLNRNDEKYEEKLCRHEDWLSEHNMILSRHNETIKAIQEKQRQRYEGWR